MTAVQLEFLDGGEGAVEPFGAVGKGADVTEIVGGEVGQERHADVGRRRAGGRGTGVGLWILSGGR
jgi:hypothetical protein